MVRGTFEALRCGLWLPRTIKTHRCRQPMVTIDTNERPYGIAADLIRIATQNIESPGFGVND